MEALDKKKPNMYPLYLGHIIQFVKDSLKFQDDQEVNDAFSRESFTKFKKEYYDDLMVKHDFQLGGGVDKQDDFGFGSMGNGSSF